jgi:aspartyl-tRNA(Asn)/glutamyl-tRNA(Gln) amidotransferase subunit A
MTNVKTSAESVLDGYFIDHTLDSLGSALRAGTLTAAELVEHTLESIHRINPILNAFVGIDASGARAAAAEADADLRRGIDAGPLHGIPVAVKDIIDIAGQATSAGSALNTGRIADTDAPCVQDLRAAGAIIIGKTVLHEFAYGATGDKSTHGASRNPHDPDRISGGSSGGSAVAVAAGLVPVALGTDTAGSVRVPAALCGIVGFKPQFDAIGTDGVHPLAPSLDHVGLFTRTAGDLRTAYEALAGISDATGNSAAKPTVGWVDTRCFGPVDPRITTAARAALGTTSADVVDVDLDLEPGVLFEVFTTLQAGEAFSVHADSYDRYSGIVDPEVLARLDRGAQIPAWQYIHATTRRAHFTERIDTLFDQLTGATHGADNGHPAGGTRSPHCRHTGRSAGRAAVADQSVESDRTPRAHCPDRGNRRTTSRSPTGLRTW